MERRHVARVLFRAIASRGSLATGGRTVPFRSQEVPMSDEVIEVPPRLPDESIEEWLDRINEANDYSPSRPEEPQSEVEPYDPEKFQDVRLPYSESEE
jgi:hypothetical protein